MLCKLNRILILVGVIGSTGCASTYQDWRIRYYFETPHGELAVVDCQSSGSYYLSIADLNSYREKHSLSPLRLRRLESLLISSEQSVVSGIYASGKKDIEFVIVEYGRNDKIIIAAKPSMHADSKNLAGALLDELRALASE